MSIYDNTLTSRLFKIKKIQVEMIQDRGFPILDEVNLFSYNVDNFLSVYSTLAKSRGTTIRASLSKFYQQTNGNHIYVFYPETSEGKKYSIGQFKELILIVHSYPSIKNVMIVTEVSLNAKVQSELDDLNFYNIEVFLYEQLIINPTKHYLTPKHTLLSKEESKKYLLENRINLKQLAILSINDPVVRYFGAKVGDIFRIDRINLAFEEIVNHQVVFKVVQDTPLTMMTSKSKSRTKT